MISKHNCKVLGQFDEGGEVVCDTIDSRGKKFYKWYDHVMMFGLSYLSNKKHIDKLKGENLLSPKFQEELEEIMKGVKLNLDEHHLTV